MNCIKCGKEIYPLDESLGWWRWAAKGKIDAGYGSAHDLDDFEFMICDDCISEGMGEGTIKLINR